MSEYRYVGITRQPRYDCEKLWKNTLTTSIGDVRNPNLPRCVYILSYDQ